MSDTFKHKGKGYWNNGIQDENKFEVKKYLRQCDRSNKEYGYFKEIELKLKEKIADNEMKKEKDAL